MNVQTKDSETQVANSDVAELLNRLQHRSLNPTVSEIAEATGIPEEAILKEQQMMAIENRLAKIESKIDNLKRSIPDSKESWEHNNLTSILEFIRNPGEVVKILVVFIGIALVCLSFWYGIKLVS